jgi:hypothetical protein
VRREGWQDLQRNIAVETLVASTINHSHSAGTDLLEDTIVREGLANQRERGSAPSRYVRFIDRRSQRSRGIAKRDS